MPAYDPATSITTPCPTDPDIIAVGIIGYDGVTLLDVSGPAEVLAHAGGYRITMLSARGGTVTASNGLALAGTVPVADAPDLHTVLVPGGDLLAGSPLPADLLSEAGDLVARSSRVAAVCTGAFVLAELGLLDGVVRRRIGATPRRCVGGIRACTSSPI